MSDDHTQAAALHLARAHLEKMGWKYSARQIGEVAHEILKGLQEGKPK